MKPTAFAMAVQSWPRPSVVHPPQFFKSSFPSMLKKEEGDVHQHAHKMYSDRRQKSHHSTSVEPLIGHSWRSTGQTLRLVVRVARACF